MNEDSESVQEAEAETAGFELGLEDLEIRSARSCATIGWRRASP